MMDNWCPDKKDLKRYPHFDAVISADEAKNFANDSKKVELHTFYPFMLYKQRWTKYNKKGQKGEPKERPIRFAARKDAYIFARYRYVLSKQYELELRKLKLSDKILAYRQIKADDGKQGKSNINFAYEAFCKITEAGNCTVIALDISKYFESLDHAYLKCLWARLLKKDKLPKDHFRVFEAITKYSVVDKEKVYERLGHYGDKRQIKSGKWIKGYITPYKNIKKHLCSGKEFQEKIAGGNGMKSLIQKNYKPYGIPQGAPISDLLANLYLIEFDQLVCSWISEAKGTYYRYSDDILIILPGDIEIGRNMMEKVRNVISNFGNKLLVKPEKSSLFIFKKDDIGKKFELIEGEQGKNGLEYLGFRFDGKKVYLRDATISNLRRKVSKAAYQKVFAHLRRYPNKNLEELKALFNYEEFIKKFGKVEEFKIKQDDYKQWTFWTYALRASKTFGPIGRPILRQLRNHKKLVNYKINQEMEKAFKRRTG